MTADSNIQEASKIDHWFSISGISLLVANLVPAIGMLFWNWSIVDLLWLGWCEALVVAGYALLKIAMIDRGLFLVRGPIVAIAFGFMVIFLMGLISMIQAELQHLLVAGGAETGSPHLRDALRTVSPALIGLVVSHGLSFVTNFVRQRQYRDASSEDIAIVVFGSILKLMAWLFVVALIVSIWGNALVLFVSLIAVKAILDFVLYLKEVKGTEPSEGIET